MFFLLLLALLLLSLLCFLLCMEKERYRKTHKNKQKQKKADSIFESPLVPSIPTHTHTHKTTLPFYSLIIQFHAAMRGELGLVNISDQDMNELMDLYDEDGDGEVTYDEFAKQIFVKDFSDRKGSVIDFPSNHNNFDPKENLSELMKEARIVLMKKSSHLRKIFRNMSQMGANDDGEVRRNEFIAFLRNNNIGVGREEAMKHLFQLIDKDRSGSVSFTEFAQALNSSDQEKEDGNFFCGGGRDDSKKNRGQQMIKIGRKRLHQMLLDKIEQKAKNNSTFARTSEHVLKKLFKEFDTDDSGELDQSEFRQARKLVFFCFFCLFF